MIATLLNVLLPLVTVAGMVALIQPWLRLDGPTLSRLTFRLLLPALTLQALLDPALTATALGRSALGTLLLILVLLGSGEIIAWFLRLEDARRGAFVLVLLLANVGALGLPVLSFGLGEAALIPGSIGVVVFNGMVLPLVSIYLTTIKRAPLRNTLLQLSRDPILYAALLGGLLRLLNVELPLAAVRIVELLAQGAIPILLIVLGIQLRTSVILPRQPRTLSALALVVLIQLFLAPLLALFIAQNVGLQGLFRDAFVIQQAMPVAILTTVLALEFDVDATFVTLSVLTTTFLSLFTVTLWLQWLS